MQYGKEMTIKGRKMHLPVFYPDATRGVIRGLDSADLNNANIKGLIVNTYHLMSQPGASVLKQYGGIKEFIGWDGLIISDSGGFQLLSMINENASFGSISSKGITFRRGSKGDKNKYQFTPEKCIQMQFALQADIMICLDNCPSIKATPYDVKTSVDLTIKWARECKEEYNRQVKQRKLSDESRPLLFGVIQGGSDREERERCAKELLKIGFDGFGFGGWPLEESGKLDLSLLSDVSVLIPDSYPKYALGIGTPQDIVDCVKIGYTIFDCVLPTRDARHRRLYVFKKDPKTTDIFDDMHFWGYQYVLEEKYVRDQRPISEFCDCYTCQNFSRGYLHHLFTIEDVLAPRLATIHNLRMYSILMEAIRSYGH